MNSIRRLGLLLGASIPLGGAAQVTVPRIVQLPTDPFVWQWGEATIDDRTRPDFEIFGTEEGFNCNLTGSFRLGSRMRDFTNLREFRDAMSTTLYFIQETTFTLNDFYRTNQLDWATLDCGFPETPDSDDRTQERMDRALERAQRDRERRRRREERDSEE